MDKHVNLEVSASLQSLPKQSTTAIWAENIAQGHTGQGLSNDIYCILAMVAYRCGYG